ncbi:hypothetical protein [Salinarimonas ramus]|uniref:Uncharacterized protein n=1 Tax=Salinarimonas ramus TaxID=690164 RepID=A0A917Q3Z1_9HYPH|nr:hypothetical protein [Salinarimonas ramus]GGK18107.1 hypothetical protein GCM10011322_01020 [Salinarimonas ramus]
MHEFLIVLPWIGAVLVIYGLRGELAKRGREITAWWGMRFAASGGAAGRRRGGETCQTTDGELEELRRRYAEAPEDTRAAVMKLLAR